jgi:hypothetical protein
MDMTQAAIFLAGSILIMIGMIVIISGAVIINQILQKLIKVQMFLTKIITAQICLIVLEQL